MTNFNYEVKTFSKQREGNPQLTAKTGAELSIDYNNLYMASFGEEPRHIRHYVFSFKERPFTKNILAALEDIFEEFGITDYHSESSSIKSNYYDDEDSPADQKNKIDMEKLYLKSLYFDVLLDEEGKHGIGISVKTDGNVILNIMSNCEESTFEKKVVKHITSEFKKIIGKKEATVCFICDDSSLYLKQINIKGNPKKYNLSELYNDDFTKTSEHIVRSLKKENSNGIVLLHGIPGTGKTSYLRYLISHITNKRIIYVPPDLMHRIGSPEFFRFLLDYKNSILILEDSENIIKIREGGESAAVANLLNLTDGIMGDALSFQVICTFNAKINVIDPALMRSGRMIANYEFKELELEKTKSLISKINENVDVSKITKGETLANIFNYKNDAFTLASEAKKSGELMTFVGMDLN
jgi:ATP-dependent 26S proteasome regulatory subunit